MLRRLLFLASALVLASSSLAFAAGRITGRVVDFETTAPIADAQVMLLPVPERGRPIAPVMPAVTRSASDGAFTFENVAPGRYMLQGSKPGLATMMSAESAMAGAITIAGDETVSARDVLLRRGGIITGRVVDTSGEPVPELMVRVEALTPGPARAFIPPVQTNDVGEFRLAGVPPGDSYLVVSPRPAMFGGAFSAPASGRSASGSTVASSGYLATYYPATTDRSRATPITIAAGQTLPGLEVTIQRGALRVVTGVVVDAAGQAAADIALMLGSIPGQGAAPTVGGVVRADEKGAFTINGVQDGEYRLNVVRMSIGGGPASANVMFNPVLTPEGTPFSVPVTVKGADVSALRVVIPNP